MDFYKTLASSGLFFFLFLLFSLLSLSGDNAYATSHNRQINFIIIVEAKKDQKIKNVLGYSLSQTSPPLCL